ncbi:hypothetical protein ACN20G_02650 [Streptomyces sp. BI20]|uniref:hypothetical protein n=1 Tax=Streptomyces sp. BI20 TaxID=3403460 RepID=UPI003C7496EC
MNDVHTPHPTDRALLRAAIHNNTAWCAAVCATHDVPTRTTAGVWHGLRPAPPLYPDAVTLDPGLPLGRVLAALGAGGGPARDLARTSVKDSHADLDLTAAGFDVLFDARWIHHPAPARGGARDGRRAGWSRVRTAPELATWERAWRGPEGSDGGAGSEAAPSPFRPGLLAHPDVAVLAEHDPEGRVRAGAVLHHAAGVLGVSNLFTGPGNDMEDMEGGGAARGERAAWDAVLGWAARHRPGVPLVGYESGDALPPALAAGFRVLGPLRVWLHRG